MGLFKIFNNKRYNVKLDSSAELKRKEFFEDTAPFIEAGLLKVIYANEALCICNMANQCYCVFPYFKSPEGQCGILINPEYVREIAKDSSFFARLVHSMDKKLIQKRTVVLNSKNFQVLKKMKNRTDANGPTEDIDYEMEKEISNIKR